MGFEGLCGIGVLSHARGAMNIFLPNSTVAVWVLVSSAVLGLFVEVRSKRSAIPRPVFATHDPFLPPAVVVKMVTSQGENIGVNQHGGSGASEPPVTLYFDSELQVLRNRHGRVQMFKLGEP